MGLSLFVGTGLINSPFGSLDVFVYRLAIKSHSQRNFGETEFVLKFQGKSLLLLFGQVVHVLRKIRFADKSVDAFQGTLRILPSVWFVRLSVSRSWRNRSSCDDLFVSHCFDYCTQVPREYPPSSL